MTINIPTDGWVGLALLAAVGLSFAVSFLVPLARLVRYAVKHLPEDHP